MVSFTPSPVTLLRRKEPLYPLNRRLGRLQTPSGFCDGEKNPSLPGIDHCHPACSIVTAMTELSRLMLKCIRCVQITRYAIMKFALFFNIIAKELYSDFCIFFRHPQKATTEHSLAACSVRLYMAWLENVVFHRRKQPDATWSVIIDFTAWGH